MTSPMREGDEGGLGAPSRGAFPMVFAEQDYVCPGCERFIWRLRTPNCQYRYLEARYHAALGSVDGKTVQPVSIYVEHDCTRLRAFLDDAKEHERETDQQARAARKKERQRQKSNTEKVRRSQWKAVLPKACPKCKVEPGNPCINMMTFRQSNGAQRVPVRWPHVERLLLVDPDAVRFGS